MGLTSGGDTSLLWRVAPFSRWPPGTGPRKLKMRVNIGQIGGDFSFVYRDRHPSVCSVAQSPGGVPREEVCYENGPQVGKCRSDRIAGFCLGPGGAPRGCRKPAPPDDGLVPLPAPAPLVPFDAAAGPGQGR